MFSIEEELRIAGLKPASPNKSREIEFVVEAPEAKEVFLAGSFNNWDSHSLPMKKNRRGLWKTTVELAPGRYSYKFMADGAWITGAVGTECPEVVVADTGGMNCVYTVESQLAA
jgi:1,4-alpha-glucan branching enzyme